MSKPVGIIGSACRFPGDTDSPSKLWDLLKAPRDVLSEFAPERLNLKSFYHENGEHHGSTDVQNKGYLLSEDIRVFDAPFFRISPAEADGMDPQQRILLETVYEALESAGCSLEQVQGSLTSVYAGLMNGDFADIQARDLDTIQTHHGTGTHRSILSNRVSYFLDVKGASMTIDTACSSSLVALHQAVQSLRLGESDMAIVAGANLIIDPGMYVAESKLHMLSPDSRSRMWDASANGYARGEGFAAIILKPLDKAIRDRDDVECVIRGIAVNSDGRSAGITVPNARAQTVLIQQAYRDAGLDPLVDRCQFFEAHGTGTRAGDPVEAKAIYDAFYPDGRNEFDESESLLVGSIKTVVGHLEGAAGLAGVLKASLAMQNRTIPPNLHFTELNPAISPFYDCLQIPIESSEWPAVPKGSPLRASVNSFGFGGTNAHVVLESFDRDSNEDKGYPNYKDEGRFIGPLLLSANSKDSLVESVKAHANYIRTESLDLNLDDLTWTLESRRTHFDNSRAFFSGSTREKLIEYMDMFVAENSTSAPAAAPSEGPWRSIGDDGPAILGIFTGQGAQWPTMGRSLILHNLLFRRSIQFLEASLAELGDDAPSWSLERELLAEEEISRVTEATISQPLCTAVQIGLVDILRASGIKMRSVVGHSSGEIAAVYAAGIISARDAIRIAYYRGFHAKLAKGPGEEHGAMMAVGISFESATELCERPEFAGRVNVAAANAPTSVTVSGDADAIEELKIYLDSEKTFARKLNVDTAYHSHHMKPSSAAYLKSLKECEIQINPPTGDCLWISSVHGDPDLILDYEDDESVLDVLKDEYWVENLLSPVLFAPAVESALWRAGPFDILTEVGPHPALKGPVTQILKASLGSSLPYFSIMRRGDDEVEAFSGGLGYLWQHFGPEALIDFDGYRNSFVDAQSQQPAPRLVKGLPSYSWDHRRIHWKESRLSSRFRLGDRSVHELLGRRATDDTPELLRWRNILRPAEFPWVRDHAFQGQIVLPGASYVAAITEAAKTLAGNAAIKLLEILDFKIPRAIVLQENKSTELTTSLRLVNQTGSLLSAEFAFSAAAADDANAVLEKTCTGRVEIYLGEARLDQQSLPLPGPYPPNLNDVDLKTFYKTLKTLGIDYQGSFRATKSAERTMGFASSRASWETSDLGNSYTLHPAILDVGFHALLAAFAAPSTGHMWTMYLPVGIRRLSIDMASFLSNPSKIDAVNSAQITKSSAKGIEGDIQILLGSRVGVQVEGIELQATGDPLANKDRALFSHTKWDVDISSGFDRVVLEMEPDLAADDVLVEAMGRTALFYYRNLLDDVSPREMKTLAWHMQMFWQSAQHWVEEVSAGRHPDVKREWMNDTREEVWTQAEGCQDSIDIRLMRALGEVLPSIVRGETSTLQVMLEDDMLNRFYAESYGLSPMNDYIARTLGQITHRYPQANILEIGAGVGGTTRKILPAVGNAFNHYTFTDISSGFFEKGAEKFAAHRSKMTFKVCDIEKDPIEQGFTEEGYDIIVAANVLHATRCMTVTMQNVRRLLKPGGFLVMMEITGDMMRLGFIMGPLPGWWFGAQISDEGRQWSPSLTLPQWDDILRRTGFSGVNKTVSNHVDPDHHYVSTIVSQAVDEKIDLLRAPLSNLSFIPPLGHKLLILGGGTLAVARLNRGLKKSLETWDTAVEIVPDLDKFSLSPHEQVSVISLMEIGQPLFATEITTERLEKIQKLVRASSSILWLTAGARGPSPVSNIFVGLSRALRTERPDISIQILDVDKASNATADILAEYFIRLALSKVEEFANKSMLWTVEAEIGLDGDKLLIPRLLLDDSRNERYNATRRNVLKRTTLGASEVEISAQGEVVTLLGVEKNLSRRLIKGSRDSILDVNFSVAFPHQNSEYILSYGSCDSRMAFAVTQRNTSVVPFSPHNGLFLDTLPSSGIDLVGGVAAQLIVRSLAITIPLRGAVLVYEPPSTSFVDAIQSSRLWKGRKIYFATSSAATPVPESWIVIDLHALRSRNDHAIPTDVKIVLDLSPSGSHGLDSLISAKYVTRRFEPSLLEVDGEGLAEAYADTLVALSENKKLNTRALSIDSISGISASAATFPVIIDWRQQHDKEIIVGMKPLEPAGIFNAFKTHLMVGLNGDLGQSICGYMIRNGARHIAISSRSGDVSSEWLDSIRRDYQADVRLYRMDVSNQQSVLSTLELIENEMPPICGVANGALVLHDKDFLNMDVESLNETLKPKVDGTKNLDEIFPDGELDYFVCFSSVAAVGNNRSQGNYHAANLFMQSLITDRRERGLAGSIIHVGVVVDAGYVARQNRKLAEDLSKQGFMPVSETDAHLLFAEGVLSSPADSGLDYDICMGVEPFVDSPDAPLRPPWYDDARLSHLIVQPEEDNGDKKEGSGEVIHIRQKLELAASLVEAHPFLQEAFSVKLGSMMQLDPGSINAHVPLLDMGFDSLLAVEMRTWFLKEIHIDVPVLRFLGGDTVTEICADTAAQYLSLRSQRTSTDQQKSDDVLEQTSNDKQDNDDKDSTQRQTSASSDSGEPASTPRSTGSSDGHNLSDIPSTPLTLVSTPDVEKVVGLGHGTAQEKNNAASGTQARSLAERDISRTETMSHAQSRLWFLDQYLEDYKTSNIAIRYRITGALDVQRFSRALAQVVAHHPSLRTCFYADENTGEPTQGLLRTPLPSTSLKCLHSLSEEEINFEFQSMRDRRWDLVNGDTFAATLFSTEQENEHFIIFGYHHIVIDGVSWFNILRDIERAYTSKPLSRQEKLSIDAAVEQRNAVRSGKMDSAIEFWLKAHVNLPSVLPLLPFASVSRRRPLRQYDSHTISIELGKTLADQIRSASKALRVTLSNFYLAAIQVFFFKILKLEDICIGITDASRTDDALANTVGFFLNMLPVRFRLNPAETFTELARQTSKCVLEGRANGEVPIDVILDRLNVPRDQSFSPLFQATFNYRVGAMAESSLGAKCHLSVEDIRDAQSPFDIGFGIHESAEGSVNLQVLTQRYMYSKYSTQLIWNAYVNLLRDLSSDTSRALNQCNIVEPTAVEKGIAAGRGPRKTWEWPSTLSKRFSDVVQTHRNEVAIHELRGSISYGDLEKHIRFVASIIRKEAHSPGSRIAVFCQPSSDLIISMLAILRSGHVYVPLDTNLPKERHAAILDDCEPTIILCHEETKDNALLLETHSSVFNLSALLPGISTAEPQPKEDLSEPDTPAILLYTSGSTGTPKGIQLNQFGFLNHLALKTAELSLKKEIVLQQSSFGFDMSLTQTFCALANGGSLVIAPKSSRGDPVAISKLMLEHHVTFTIATPSEYAMLLRYGKSWLSRCKDWKHACMGGETVTRKLFQAFSDLDNPNIRLTNCYGPTETSLAVTFNEIPISKTDDISEYASVGKVLPNNSIYILDEDSGEPVPLGYPGEICIGGGGLALGYLNLAEFSATKFVHNPFAGAEDLSRGWNRMFKTGDRGWLQDDGSLVFIGRRQNDNMIKLRGLRIDLDDVANTILHAADKTVAGAAVTLRGEEDSKFLVAHVVPRQGQTEITTEIEWQKLTKRLPLPIYMRPSLIVAIDHFPRMASGKIDYKALQTVDLPTFDSTSEGGNQKLSLQEGELSLLWEEVFGGSMAVSRANLTRDSDFFLVGGSSLLLMKLQGAIRETLGISVTVAELYQASTLGRMAAHLDREKGVQSPIEAIDWEEETHFLPSPVQLDVTAPNPIPRLNREVLLTGAHTFLGSGILQALISDNTVKRVHCIAVPATYTQTRPGHNKAAYYPGSLQSETLGLNLEDITFLQSRVDLIIHAGSVGHCLNNYSSVRAANVGSLRFLVNLAIPQRIPVHFLSSNRVTLLSGNDILPPVSVGQYMPPTDGSEGFTASKWAGERLLEKVSHLTDLPITVHRPCAVVGPNAPSEDALNALLRFAVEQNAVPLFKNLVGFLDFAPITAVAENIVRSALQVAPKNFPGFCVANVASGGKTSLSIVHHSSGVQTPIARFRRRMEELHGRTFGELDITAWINEAVKRGMDPLISTYLEAIVEKNQTISFPYLGESLEMEA